MSEKANDEVSPAKQDEEHYTKSALAGAVLDVEDEEEENVYADANQDAESEQAVSKQIQEMHALKLVEEGNNVLLNSKNYGQRESPADIQTMGIEHDVVDGLEVDVEVNLDSNMPSTKHIAFDASGEVKLNVNRAPGQEKDKGMIEDLAASGSNKIFKTMDICE